MACDFGFGELGKELADEVEDADVGGRCGARGFADGGLVHFDDGAELVGVCEGAEGGGGIGVAEGEVWGIGDLFPVQAGEGVFGGV